MKKPYPLIIIESLKELKKIRSKQANLYLQKRVDCLIFIKTSRFGTRQEVANFLGINIRTQERWINKYKKGGLELLLSDESKIRESKIITPEIHLALETKVNSSDSPFLGYWEAQQWVENTFGVTVKYHWLRKYMVTHFKTKLKSPRKSHYKKDEQAIDNFFKTTGNA